MLAPKTEDGVFGFQQPKPKRKLVSVILQPVSQSAAAIATTVSKARPEQGNEEVQKKIRDTVVFEHRCPPCFYYRSDEGNRQKPGLSKKVHLS